MSDITTYEGAWKRSATDWYGDYDRFTVDTPPDESHGDKSDAPPPLMMDAPVLQSGGEIYTDALFENYDHLLPGMTIDNTPVEGHGSPEESGHGHGGIFNPQASEQALGNARGQALGAAKKATSDSPILRFFNENWFGFFTKGFDPPPITQVQGDPILRRGLNGYPENDGDGGRPTAWSVDQDITIVGGTWRRGDYEGSNVNRDFKPPNRRHGEVKMVEADIVTIIGDAPPPRRPDTYASPFSSLQKFMPKRRKIGSLRRDPGPWDEDLIANAPVSIPTSSVDGMVVN